MKIGITEKSQIESYHSSVITNPEFDKNKTKWIFYAVSTEISKELDPYVAQTNREPGQIQVDGRSQIFIKTWGEVIQAAKGRMEFLKKKLEQQATRLEGLNDLKDNFPEIIGDVEKKVKEERNLTSKTIN